MPFLPKAVSLNMRPQILLLAAAGTSCVTAFVGGGNFLPSPIAAPRAPWRATAPRLQTASFPDDEDNASDEDGSANRAGEPPASESFSNVEESAAVDAFRAQLLRQMAGGAGPASNEGAAGGGAKDAASAEPGQKQVQQASSLSAGQVLVANPERFFSRNPFWQPVKDLNRFLLRGPIDDDDQLTPDMRASMLPVMLLIDYNKQGSRGLMMERRTGALMGDLSMEAFGAVAISPLWLGGMANQDTLYTVHDVPGVEGASQIRDGLYLNGWKDVQPQVSDSSISDARFKFFLGATEWGSGQLEAELKEGAWIALDIDPSLVIKDRVGNQRPRKPKPIWTELLQYLAGESPDVQRMLAQIYPEQRET